GSMGAMQAYEWAVRHPSLVRRVFATCGSSRITDHCSLFLSGAKAALLADQSYADGEYDEPPAAGMRAVARVWSAWSPSARFYWDREFEQLGYQTAEAFVREFWEPWYTALDANNFLNQLWTWQHADISDDDVHRGELAGALADIAALTYVVPAERDPYFPAEDAAWEAAQIPQAELHVIPGTWGHFSLSGLQPSSAGFIGDAIRSLLDR
ncbi:MAG TPA: alpha/beta fold hydrolase, partial [Baekduia sp.]|nr:alpha/beta fold hydrolase [Baekduia sp.]